ncbi:MAG: hypothetical protein Hals2KO_37260 [Halioglobus sp.]|jgi:prophage regulatory protein|nr:transcriptional regulator [Halioglobus sp.]
MSQLITKKQLMEHVPYSNTHLLRLEDAGRFPRRIKPDGKPNGKAFWVREEVEDYIQTQIDSRDNSPDDSSD